MNKEVVKAMRNKAKESNVIYKWWKKNGHKVMRVVLFPIYAFVWTKDKITNYLNSRQEWSEERAQEILSYYVPRMAQWDAKAKCFYFVDHGTGWRMKYHQRKVKLRDRRWWNCNRGFWGGKIRVYLIEKFEMEGFEKIVNDIGNDWTEITFKMIEK